MQDRNTVLVELEKLSNAIALYEERTTATLGEVGDKVELLNKLLTGNGSPERGLIVRCDRLEQSEARRQRWVRAAIGSAASAICVAVVALLKSLLRK